MRPAPLAPAEHTRSLLAVALLVVGLTFPTSVGGDISVPLGVGHFVLLLALLGAYAAFGPLPWRPTPARVWNAGLTLAVLLAATIVSPFPQLTLGATAPYVTLAMVLCLDLRAYRVGPLVRRAFVATTVVLLACGVAIAAGAEPVRELLIDHYSTAYPELVSNMTLWRKPVFTFGTHSVAGFFYYLFFHLHYETYRAEGRRLHLWLAAFCALLSVALTSVTAAIFAVVALGRLAFERSRVTGILVLGVLVAIGGLVLVRLSEDLPVAKGLALAFSANEAGFRGRFGAEGALVGNIEYLRLHPFRPIGLTYSPTLFFGDSGPLEYLLRGTIVLMASIYGGLFAMLRANLLERRQLWHLLGAIAFFEVGYTVLAVSRFAYFLPFAIVYLNGLAPGRARASARSAAPDGAAARASLPASPIPLV